MTHKRGRRNSKTQEFKTQKQAARQFACEQAFLDRIRGESVCLSTVDEIAVHLAKDFEELVPEAVPEVEPGLVLRNPIGEGAFQMIEL